MAATMTSSVMTVFGDQRVAMGIVHMSDGGGSANVGLTMLNYATVQPYSCATTGFTKAVQDGTTAGYIQIASCSSGDSFWFMAIGK